MNIKKKLTYFAIIIFVIVFIAYPLSNFNSFKKKVGFILPNSFKETIKEIIIGKEKNNKMKELYDTKLIKQSYNQKNLPETEFQKLNFKKISLKKLDLNKIPAKDNSMFVKPETKPFFIETYKNNLVLVSQTGNIYFINYQDLDKNLVNEYIKLDLNYSNIFSKVLDILIDGQKVYISYANERDENCFVHGIMSAELGGNKLDFKNFFNNNECVESTFAGKMALYKFEDKDGLLLSLDALSKWKNLAQTNNSLLGKIIFINKNNGNNFIFSKGHRNPQGLIVYNNTIISTEHGPRGGDEINRIKFGKNYGWPISSYGEPYEYENKNINEYSYLKNHKVHNFEEPIFSFVPSVGLSQLIKVPSDFSNLWKDSFILSSLNAGSLYRFQINEDMDKILYYEKIFIGERIRDIMYFKKNNSIILALENTGSIGILTTINDF